VFNPLQRTEYSQETTVAWTQKYPITLTMFGIGQMSRRNARCLPSTKQQYKYQILFTTTTISIEYNAKVVTYLFISLI